MKCSVDECNNNILQKGYCPKHYMKWYRHGDANFSIAKRGRTPTSISWSSMKQRCSNIKDPSYKVYGGVGISYPDEWNVFANFLSDMGERPEGTTLDRIDNSKGYSKENCRWADINTQANNKSSNRNIEYNGDVKTIMELSRAYNIPYTTLKWRIDSGWSIKDAIEKPVRIKLEKGLE